MASIAANPIEGDGVIENLYYYLWCKDEMDFGPKINIPDTIIYRFKQPAFWYFTGKDGVVKKKLKSNTTAVKIEQAFADKNTGCDIVAYFMYNTEDSEGLWIFIFKTIECCCILTTVALLVVRYRNRNPVF